MTDLEIKMAAERLVKNTDYRALTEHVQRVMDEALLQAPAMDADALRAAALQREAMLTVVGYIEQLAEPVVVAEQN